MPSKGVIPDPKLGASLVYYQNCLYLFGYTWPESSNNINDTNIYEYNLTTNYWNIVNAKNATLSKRAYQSSIVLNDSMIILFGIILEDPSPLFDIWKFNFTTSEWSFILNFVDRYSMLATMNLASVTINSTFYSFFGRSFGSVLNSVYSLDFSKENPSPVVLANNQNSPTQRKNHCSVIICDIMFIFGGISSSGVYLNDVWRFYLSNNTWASDVSSGSTPTGRELFGCSVFTNLIIIFGGKDSANIYNDLYLYDTSRQIWKNFGSTSSISLRYNTCIVQSNFYTLIIGGTNDLVIFDEIWAFNYLSSSYSLINSKDELKFKLIDFKCFMASGDNSVYVIGGRDSNYKPDNNIYNIQILETNNSIITNTSIILTSQNNIPSESPIIIDGHLIYVLFGSVWDNIMFSTVWVINYTNKAEYVFTITPSIMLFGHSGIHYEDSIYIFGGGFSTGSIKSANTASNQLYKLNTNINDTITLGCSPGTISPNCEPCPAGTYFSFNYCEPCPVGKYSTSIASTSLRLCIPCDYGFYSDKTGATYCKECTKYEYCPIGSSNPKANLVKSSYESIQPQAYSSQTNYVSGLVSQLWYIVSGSSVLISLIVISVRTFWENIQQFDVFVNQHDQPLGKAVIYRKTKAGGLFTIYSALGAGVIIISAFLSFTLDNITELKSLVPIIIIDTPISASKLYVTVTFYLYGGTCTENDSICMNANSFTDSGFNYSNKAVTCQLISENCIVSIEYNNISLEATSTIQIQMTERTAAASGISVLMNCSSSIPSELSSVFIPIYTDSENEIFIGVQPTIVQFDFTPSVYFI